MKLKKVGIVLAAAMLASSIASPVFAAENAGSLAAAADLSEEEKAVIEEQSQKEKVNTILITDGEHDDMASMVRYLSMANEFNTKGIILGASAAGHHTGGTVYYEKGQEIMTPQEYGDDDTKWAKTFQVDETYYDDGSVASRTYSQKRWTGMTWIDYYLDKYDEVDENLRVHDESYPTADELRSLVKYGNMKVVGEMDEVTEGSEWIKDCILNNPDGEKLYIQHWGGTNTTARALRSIKEEYEGTPEWESILEKINNELVIYMIWESQAPTYVTYISKEWPGITSIVDQDLFFSFYQTYTQPERHDEATQEKWFSDTWADTIINIGSPLTSESLMRYEWDLSNKAITDPENKFYSPASYEGLPFDEDDNFPFETWGDNDNTKNLNGWFMAEGDTLGYLYLVDNGLRSFEAPSWGGWGGRYGQSDNPERPNEFRDNVEDVPAIETTVTPKNWVFSRWIPDIQGIYSLYADWSVSPNYEDTNHLPKCGVMNGLDLTASAGEEITLNGVAYDPDGDTLTYRWWRYADADIHADVGTMEVSDTEDAVYTIPEDAKSGDTIHLIFEVEDSEAELPARAYQRVVITVE